MLIFYMAFCYTDNSTPQEANCYIDQVALDSLKCNRFASFNAKPDMQHKMLLSARCSTTSRHFNYLKTR